MLADLAVLTVVLARLTPFAGLTTVVGAIPFAVLGARHRPRVLWIAFLIAVVLTFLLAGFSAATQVLVMATFGGVVGRAFRDGWSRLRTVLMGVAVGWTIVASLTVAFLWVFAGLRQLQLDAARVQWDGIANSLSTIGLDVIVDAIDPRIDWIIEHWWASIPLVQLVISVFLTLFVIRMGRPVVQRVERAFGTPPPVPEATRAMARSVGVSPVGLTIVTGPNGAGKSTLLRALADQHLATHQGNRGEIGGLAVIGQRPESQVVGVRVADDLRWGLEPAPAPDAIDAVLEAVGLAGFAERETGALSGGELQRLALAAAMLRRPNLLLSDESTAMLDPGGRRIVASALRQLADDGVSVVHVTHVEAELELADRVIEL